MKSPRRKSNPDNVSPAAEVIENQTLTAGDLIYILSQYDKSTPVVCSSDYGDRCHTEQCLPLDDNEIIKVSMSRIKDSAYSSSGAKVDLEDFYDHDEKYENGSVIVIRLS